VALHGSIAQWLDARWYGRPGILYALAPLSLAYRGARALRAWAYRRSFAASVRLPVPVIVIGNITAGGTGKTPLTIWLTDRLRVRGCTPGVICRSYGASAALAAEVQRNDAPSARGDEAVLLANRLDCPVWSGPDRGETARALLRANPQIDLLVCDDGLQHAALARDCEIAVIDAQRGLGNGWLLPVGPLRDPPARLASVDAIVVNGENPSANLPSHRPRFRMRLEGHIFRGLEDASRTAEAADFTGLRIAAVAGIGNPDRFFAHLQALGLRFDARRFPDHHAFSASDFALPGIEIILMTEKDAIKCRAIADPRMWVLPVAALVDDALLELVLDRISAPRARSARIE